jgi:hypothetical protein
MKFTRKTLCFRALISVLRVIKHHVITAFRFVDNSYPQDLPQSVEFVDYDADSEDDAWLARRDYRHSLLACVFYANVSYWFYIRIHGDRISCHSFETMIDRLECAAPGQVYLWLGYVLIEKVMPFKESATVLPSSA